jgi:hypothetical protein
VCVCVCVCVRVCVCVCVCVASPALYPVAGPGCDRVGTMPCCHAVFVTLHHLCPSSTWADLFDELSLSSITLSWDVSEPHGTSLLSSSLHPIMARREGPADVSLIQTHVSWLPTLNPLYPYLPPHLLCLSLSVSIYVSRSLSLSVSLSLSLPGKHRF